MYERSAIVLERYFADTLGYSKECNIKDNYDHYCNLVEKLEKYQINYKKELIATQDCNNALKEIKAIQVEEEKLYKQSANLEYNRNILFNNIDNKSEDTRKCIEKIEEDVEKNNEALIELKDKFIIALEEYENKKFELSKCKRYKSMAENEYNEILDISVSNFEGIEDEDIEIAKEFAKFKDIDSIKEILIENGSKEKIPFNEGVMECATKFGVEVAKNEVATYVSVYEKMTRLLTDIENGVAKIELHKKYVRNEKAKIDFIMAVKEYIVQFFDYERMTIIHGTKSHNRLMNEACENFDNDIVQINNLYELLLKEISKKATKKAYRELYNKSYLIEIKEKEEKFKKEKNKVNLNTATLINSNYWRIEGIRGIYTVFYHNVSEVFGRDVVEFDIPKEFDLDSQEEVSDEVEEDGVQEEKSTDKDEENTEKENAEEEKEKEKEKEKKQKVVAKIPFEISVDLEDNIEDEIEELEEIKENIKSKKLSKKVFDINKLKFDETEEDETEEDIVEDNEVEDEDDKAEDKKDTKKEKNKSGSIKNLKSKAKSKLIEDEEEFEINDDKIEDEIDSLDEDDDKEEIEDEDIDDEDIDDDEDLEEQEDNDINDEEEFDIFGEKYQDIDFLENKVMQNSRKNSKKSSNSKKSKGGKVKYTGLKGILRRN